MDYSSLTRPVTPQELQGSRQISGLIKEYQWIGYVLAGVVILSIALPFVAGLIFAVISGHLEAVILPFLQMLVVGGIITAIVVFSIFAGRAKELRRFRLREFAARNKLRYSSDLRDPKLNGMIFSIGNGRILDEWLRDEAGRFAVGNYQYSTGSGKNRQTFNWGYLAIPLKRNLPHMVLDAKSNNISLLFGMQLTNLPVSFARDQTLALEGDFNNYFTLYAPKEYERDALYVFAPDLMALLVDNSARYDVELVDDTLYVYGATFDLLSQATWEHLMRIVETVGKKAAEQTKLYVDERVGDPASNVVAAPARQLKQGVSTAAIVGGVIFLAMFAFQVLSLSSFFTF